MSDLYKNKKNGLDTQALYGVTRKELGRVIEQIRETGEYLEGDFEIVENKSLKRLEVYEREEDGKFMTGIFPLGGDEDLVVGGALKYLKQSIKDQVKVRKIKDEILS